jgi:protein-S-isoprenylcysteine O-methyltransferase Ste14
MSRLFVWLGGALFVTSLGLTTWWYLIVLAVPGRDLLDMWRGRHLFDRGPASLVFDLAIFSAFALHHSVFAREPVKAALAHLCPKPLLRSVYVWTASLLLAAVVVLWSAIGGDLYRVTGWRAALFGVVQLAGVAIIARAVATIDPLELAGIRNQIRNEVLQVTGPYRWVRHPLYLGWVLAAFGAPHMTGDRLAFAAITTIYLMLAVPWEERSLLKSFGDDYRRYQERVRWRIVPYVY